LKRTPQQGRMLQPFASLPHCLVSLLLVACAAAPQKQAGQAGPALEIEGIEIRNELAHGVSDVTILIPQTGDFVSCGNIIQATSCSTTFPGRSYQGHKVQITWKEQGVPHSTDEFAIKPPELLKSGLPIWIEVVIFAPGQAGARMVQHEH
jgi:hypothetical protein